MKAVGELDRGKTHYRSDGANKALDALWRTLLATVLAFALASPTANALEAESSAAESTGIETPPPDTASEISEAVQDGSAPSAPPQNNTPLGIPSPTEVQGPLSDASIAERLSDVALASSSSANMELGLAWDASMFTSDTTVSDNATTLVRATSAKTTLILKYTLHIQLSDAEFKKDEAEIRIPSVLGNYRNGSAVTLSSSNVGLGTDPDKATESVPFYYFIDSSTKECVIRNAFDLSQAAQAHIEIAYSVDPVQVIDMSSAEIAAQGTFPDGSGGTATVTSAQTLKYTLDTSIELDSVALKSEMLYYWPDSLKSPDTAYTPPAMDTSQYRYVKYTANAYSPSTGNGRTGNQIYDLALKLTPDTGGTIVYQYFSSSSWRSASFEESTNTMTLSAPEPLVRTGDVLAGTGTSAFIFVVAYPKSSAQSSYTATLEGKATPGDGIDPSTEAQTSSTLDWNDYVFTYPPGKILDFRKEIKSVGVGALDLLDAGEDTSAIEYMLKADAQYYPKENDPHYPGVSDPMRIGMLITDDLLYLSTDNNPYGTTTKQQLSGDDYRIASASLSIVNTLTDRSSGQTSTPDLSTAYPGATVQVSFMVRGASVWTAADSYPMAKNISIAIPANAYRIRVDIPPVLKDKTNAILTVGHVLRGTSPTFRSMRDKNDESQTLYLFNYAGSAPTVSGGSLSGLPTEDSYNTTLKTLGMPAFDQSNYSQYLIRASNNTKLSAVPHFSSFSKKATGAHENEGGNALLEYQLTAVSGYGSNTSTAFTLAQYNTLVEKGLPPASLDRAVFYDLLPRGAHVVTSGTHAPTAKNLGTGSPAPGVSVSVVNNYRNTDRQLVRIEVTSNLAAGKNVYGRISYAQYVYANGAMSGYSANIWVSVPFDDVPLVNGTLNTAAFQNPDRGLIAGTSSTPCYPDTGADPKLEDVKGFDGQSAFYNLANNPDGPDPSLKNTMYASATMSITNSVSYGDGLANSVKTDTFIDESLYASRTSVLVGQPYIYRLSLISGTKPISNAILFDNFGQASIDGNESTWNGTFEKLDLGNAVFKGIAPVVYYTTEEHAPYFTVDDVTNGTVPLAWSTDEPSNKADVRGVAVDISHDTSGNPYAIPLAQSVSLYITMRAPSALPLISGLSLLDSTATELNEYNQAAYYALVDGVPVDPSMTALSAPTVTTKLVEPQLVKSNSPDDWVSHQDTITYTLSYTNETTETQPLMLTDAAPTGTKLAPAKSGSALAGNPTLAVADAPISGSAASDATTGAVSWTCTVPPGKSVVATYEVVVESSAQGEIPNTASALIEDAATSTHVPFESNEVVNRVKPPLEKTVENAGASGDKAKPGDTLTYTLAYTNKTTGAQKVAVTDAAPTGTSLAGGTGNPAAAVNGASTDNVSSVSGNTITWTIDALQPGEELVVSFEVVVNGNAADGSTVENIGAVYVDDATVGIESNPVDTTVEKPDDPAPPDNPGPTDPEGPDVPGEPGDPENPNDPSGPDSPTGSETPGPDAKPLPVAPTSEPKTSMQAHAAAAQTGDSDTANAAYACVVVAAAAFALALGARQARRSADRRH